MCDYSSRYEKQFTQLNEIAAGFCCLIQHFSLVSPFQFHKIFTS